jgi:phosphoribosylglycinamide formyltransferase-1
MSGKLKVAVLISGRGSNLQALIDACAAPNFPAQIVLVISNVANVQGLERARAAGIATEIIAHTGYDRRETFDAAMDSSLAKAGVELICLAGFMRILGDDFVRKWQGHLINIHPSLLPAFKGTHVHEQALDAGVKISGCTVHYVISELDSGPAIAQAAVAVRDDDTAESLAKRVLEAEHRLYPSALKLIAEGRARLDNGRVVFHDCPFTDGLLQNPMG